MISKTKAPVTGSNNEDHRFNDDFQNFYGITLLLFSHRMYIHGKLYNDFDNEVEYTGHSNRSRPNIAINLIVPEITALFANTKPSKKHTRNNWQGQFAR